MQKNVRLQKAASKNTAKKQSKSSYVLQTEKRDRVIDRQADRNDTRNLGMSTKYNSKKISPPMISFKTNIPEQAAI